MNARPHLNQNRGGRHQPGVPDLDVEPLDMHIRIASFLLITSAVTLSFVCVLIAWLVPPAFRSLYSLKSFDEVREFMPAITRLASDHSWFIAVLLAGVCFASLVALRRLPDRAVQCITVGLCAQGLVMWAAMFCFCFEGLTGPMSLHHGPEFDVVTFVLFGAGVFPVTLLLVVAPMIAALWPRVISKP
jgi:hypothetical protein